VGAVAVLAGTDHVTGIAKWAADLPEELLLRLHLRRSPTTNKVRPPSLSTLKRALAAIDRDALGRIVCDNLEEQVRARRGSTDRCARSAHNHSGAARPVSAHPVPTAALTAAGAVARNRPCSSGTRPTARRGAKRARPTGGRCTCSRR